jgi:hypothetical protein
MWASLQDTAHAEVRAKRLGGTDVYIGLGTVVLIVIIVLVVMMLRRR